jgi:hypothetical protein
MKLDAVTYAIENGKHLGIQMKTGDNEIGWFKIFKLKVANNFFEKYSKIDDEYLFEEQIRNRDCPYLILECKVTREFFSSNTDIKNNSDFLLRRTYNFSTLDDVFLFFNSKDYSLNDFVWMVDLKHID